MSQSAIHLVENCFNKESGRSKIQFSSKSLIGIQSDFALIYRGNSEKLKLSFFRFEELCSSNVSKVNPGV